MPEISYEIALVLIISGIIVGFVNTLAGGATIVSMTTFLALGIPIVDANGTNRVAIVMQNLASTVNFHKKKLLNIRLGLKLAIPTIVGNIVGSQVASTIDENIFKWCLGIVLTGMLAIMAFSTNKRLKGDGRGEFRVGLIHYFWFLLIGFYSGYIYIGLGYLILGVTILSMHMDVVRANALKAFVVLVSTPFSLAVFMWNGHVVWIYGLIHGAGNVLGALIASQWAVNWGTRFLQLFMVVVIIICMADLFNIISIRDAILNII